jgi:ABC-type phosphate/phosphonate transport system substrate-binding protein
MNGRIWLGAVAFDPKVVTIWEGMRRYFKEEAGLPVEVVLFQNYERQVEMLLSGKIDIAWNTNLAYVKSEFLSRGQCPKIAMRDTDCNWTTKIITLKGAISTLEDLRGKVLALGSRDSAHATILPIYFLEKQGLSAGLDYNALRFDTDVGKHGDTGTSEVNVLRAVMDGTADAGAVGSPFMNRVEREKLVPEGTLRKIWQSPTFTHCVFTGRPGLDSKIQELFANALFGMKFENDKHRPILEMEGLRRWLKPEDGYGSLREAAAQQGMFDISYD